MTDYRGKQNNYPTPVNRFINIKNTYYFKSLSFGVLNTLPTDTDDFLELILMVQCLSLMRINTALASQKLETLIISVEHVLNIKPGRLIQGMNVSAMKAPAGSFKSMETSAKVLSTQEKHDHPA